MELFESTSVVATDKASNVSSWTSLEGGLEGFREEEALCSLDVRCDACALSEISTPYVGHPSIQRRRVRLEQI